MKKNVEKTGVGSIVIDGAPAPDEDCGSDHERIRSRLSRLFRRCSTEGACGALLCALEDYRLSVAR